MMGVEPKILVADDSLTIQKVIRLALANEGYEIKAVSSGSEVTEQIALFQPNVVLIDANMPDRSIWDIRQEFLNHPDYPNLKFIVMTSAFENLDEDKFQELQFHGKLMKPFDPSHLRGTIESVMNTTAAQGANAEVSLDDDLWGSDTGTTASPPPLEDEDDEITSTDIKIQIPKEENEEDEIVTGSIQVTPPPPPPEASNPSIQLDEISNTNLEVIEDSSDPDDDIRRLTDETLSSVANEELDATWAIQESHAVGMQGSPSVLETHSADLNTRQMDSSPDEPTLEPPGSILEEDDLQIEIHETASEESSFAPIDSLDDQITAEEPNVVPLTAEQMEEMLGKQFQETIERMAKEILPGIAEKVIRDEIHKLLKDPPA